MEIYIKVEADREEGKHMSALLVGEELARNLEGESVDVEDSIYNVTSIEVVDMPKKSGAKASTKVEDLVYAVVDKFMEANPIVVDGPRRHIQTEEEMKALEAALMNLALSDEVGDFTKKARIRVLEARRQETKVKEAKA